MMLNALESTGERCMQTIQLKARDTIIDLQRRWERDCIAHHPNVVSVLVGINDVWQLTMEPDVAMKAADPGRYEVTYDQLLSRAADRCNCQFVLMEPFMFCRDRHNPVFSALMPYIEIVHRLAAKYDAVLVPLQREIDRRIAEVPPETWSDDSVHPHVWAHAWIALQWLQATGLWPKMDVQKFFRNVDSGGARTKRKAGLQRSIFLTFSPLHLTRFSLICRYLFDERSNYIWVRPGFP